MMFIKMKSEESPEKYLIKEITNKNIWNNALLNFDDANIYQTWNFALITQNEKSVKHLAVYNDDEIIGMALVRYRTDPVFKRGVAYIFSGPIWQRKNHQHNLKDFTDILKVFRRELVAKQKYLLRVKPFIFTDQIQDINFEKDTEFKRTEKFRNYQSIVLYLNKELLELRKGLKDRWIRYLKKAEKSGLKVVEGNNAELFKIVINLYEEMHLRKKFKIYVNINRFAKLQEELVDELKPKVFVIYKDDVPIAGSIISAIGKTGIGLFGASNELGKKYYGSYLAYWEEIKWLKEKGCLRYDLGGIDPKNNQSLYYFKTGISDHEITRVGVFEACDSLLSKVFVRIADLIFKK
jgi:lipid II:glycine glycyltransferase (peptidoglycan interpeptide bridge formation enzyme)